jgi:hypothetical protein
MLIQPHGNRGNAPRLLGVRAASARNFKTLRSLRVISIVGMLPAPRINDVLHRVTFATLWESPQESGSRAVGTTFFVQGLVYHAAII